MWKNFPVNAPLLRNSVDTNMCAVSIELYPIVDEPIIATSILDVCICTDSPIIIVNIAPFVT